MQNAAAAFVDSKYGNMGDVLNLNWLLIEERMRMNIAKLAYKGPHNQNFKDYLKLSSNEIQEENNSKKTIQNLKKYSI